MFGRQDDVIKQDQKRNADISLPDDAFAALTNPPATSSQTDGPAEASSAPTTPSMPIVTPPSIDGISSGPTNSLASPFDLMESHKRALQNALNNPTTEQEKKQVLEEIAEENQALLPETTEISSEQSPENNPEEDKGEELSDLSYTNQDSHTLLDDEPRLAQAMATPDNNPLDLSNLDQIRHAALEQLSPLVDQLSLSPEEKFKTTMMLIQASDNQALIPVAYEAAQQIEDQKLRAQALLDVVNEINYFTKNSPAPTEQN